MVKTISINKTSDFIITAMMLRTFVEPEICLTQVTKFKLCVWLPGETFP